MKKYLTLALCSIFLFSACDFGKKKKLESENEALQVEMAEKNKELEEFWSIFNEIQEGFHQINLAEDRVDLQRGSFTEGGAASAREVIKADLEFISKTMEDNKKQIENLEALVKKSKSNSSQFLKTIQNLRKELAEKTNRIEELQTELASKNIRIQELDAAVSNLSADVEVLAEANDAKAAAVEEQDRLLNRAWFVFGTKSELKDQKILSGGGLFKSKEVLAESDYNKDYFSEIDIRTTKAIELFSKSAKLLTTHPEGSYLLEKNTKGEYVLTITNAQDFWSVTRYLVILVK